MQQLVSSRELQCLQEGMEESKPKVGGESFEIKMKMQSGEETHFRVKGTTKCVLLQTMCMHACTLAERGWYDRMKKVMDAFKQNRGLGENEVVFKCASAAGWLLLSCKRDGLTLDVERSFDGTRVLPEQCAPGDWSVLLL